MTQKERILLKKKVFEEKKIFNHNKFSETVSMNFDYRTGSNILFCINYVEIIPWDIPVCTCT